MKKVSTLFMALALALGITAAPALQPVQKAVTKKQAAKEMVKKVDLKKKQAIAAFADEPVAPVAKKAVAPKRAGSDFSATTYVSAMYWGGMTQYGYGEGDWALYLYGDDDEDYWGYLSVVTADSLHIAGDNLLVSEGELVVGAGDTVSVTGTLSISCISVLSNYPVYSFSGQFTDSLNRVHDLSFQSEVSASSYFYYRIYRENYEYYQIVNQGYCEIAVYYGYDIDCSLGAATYYNRAIDAYYASPITLEDLAWAPTGEVSNMEFVTSSNSVGSSYVDFTAQNDSFMIYISILVEGGELDGLYVAPDEMDLSWCYLFNLSDSTRINFHDISAYVETIDDTTYIDITSAHGMNGTEYNIMLKYTPLQAKDTVVIMTPDGYASLNDMTADYKQFLVQGLGLDYFVKAQQNINDVYEWSVAVDGADSIIGEFPKNMMFGVQYTYVKHYLNQGADSVVLGAIDAKLTIERVGANLDSAAITLDFLATDTVRYIIYAAVSIAPVDPYEQDEETTVNETFPSDNVTITDYFEQYGDMMLSAYSTDSSKMVQLDFYTSAAALQPGTYTIDNTASAGHAVASTGLQDGYYMYSFYATRDLSTGYIDKVWYLVSGTITVTATDVTVDALNSKGAEVHISIALPEATGIEDVLEDSKLDGKAHKLIEDGQLLIIRDGKAFNAAGQVVK